jgi:hypothetical protein
VRVCAQHGPTRGHAQEPARVKREANRDVPRDASGWVPRLRAQVNNRGNVALKQRPRTKRRRATSGATRSSTLACESFFRLVAFHGKIRIRVNPDSLPWVGRSDRVHRHSRASPGKVRAFARPESPEMTGDSREYPSIFESGLFRRFRGPDTGVARRACLRMLTNVYVCGDYILDEPKPKC